MKKGTLEQYMKIGASIKMIRAIISDMLPIMNEVFNIKDMKNYDKLCRVIMDLKNDCDNKLYKDVYHEGMDGHELIGVMYGDYSHNAREINPNEVETTRVALDYSIEITNRLAELLQPYEAAEIGENGDDSDDIE